MGATIAVDLNDVVAVNAVGLRALSDALGDDGARVFIRQYTQESHVRPRVTTAQIAEILERANAKASALSAAGVGVGDFTKERHERPDMPFEIIAERLSMAEAKQRETDGI